MLVEKAYYSSISVDLLGVKWPSPWSPLVKLSAMCVVIHILKRNRNLTDRFISRKGLAEYADQLNRFRPDCINTWSNLYLAVSWQHPYGLPPFMELEGPRSEDFDFLQLSRCVAEHMCMASINLLDILMTKEKAFIQNVESKRYILFFLVIQYVLNHQCHINKWLDLSESWTADKMDSWV